MITSRRDELERALRECVQKVRHADAELFDFGAGERSLAHRLAVYIEAHPAFREWQVDCEYNRADRAIKRLARIVDATGPDDRQRVYPDIVVHRRGLAGAENNLLVIEVKNRASARAREYDLVKLRAYRREFGYQFTAFVDFGTREVLAIDPDLHETTDA